MGRRSIIDRQTTKIRAGVASDIVVLRYDLFSAFGIYQVANLVSEMAGVLNGWPVVRDNVVHRGGKFCPD